ncbi:PAS domain-containing protein [Archangium violaceum]|uniref:ATP-binding protein n=1 Tax=Archangium violaceum TaxID=83451 RepID=UPI00195274AF|nr:ATP-binding protein [Archangium violaceum]QRN99807.1 PAS domain-containing protein [Archangium violaceum]
MAIHSSPATSQDIPRPIVKPPGLLRWLDFFLSESLRDVPPSDLVRHRVLVGSACFMLAFAVLYMAFSLFSPLPTLPGVTAGLGYAATLVTARRATTRDAPAMLLLATLTVGFVGGVFGSKQGFEGSVQAANMLLPALAVYLLGPRQGLVYTLFYAVVMTGVHPFYRTQLGITPEPFSLTRYWGRHVFAGISYVAAWGLGSLHSTTREAAHQSLERILKELRGSESKLSSIIESTDDLVVSLDTEGRVVAANSAMKSFYRKLLGKELELGQPILHYGSQERLVIWKAHFDHVLQGQRLRVEETFELEGSPTVLDFSLHPILVEGGRTAGVTLFGHDITLRKEAEARMGEMHRSLVDVSRQAGMAEVATGVLHNVGNTLNSVNISTSLVTDRLRNSRVTGLAKAANLLREHTTDIALFLSQDPQGQKLPAYLIAVSDQLTEERQAMLQEMNALGLSVEHVKSIVSMQQKHARPAGAVERMDVPQLIDEALRLHAVSFERLAIHIVRDYADVPPIYVDRHKLLQILINLLSNARHALVDSAQQDKRLTIHVRRAPEGGGLLIEMTDNGVGIAPENLARLFSQGFTTKKTGHGFGLHISALAATEMKGRLSCSSPGPGLGATFTLELPMGMHTS